MNVEVAVMRVDGGSHLKIAGAFVDPARLRG
jgi:hypothetical protein